MRKIKLVLAVLLAIAMTMATGAALFTTAASTGADSVYFEAGSQEEQSFLSDPGRSVVGAVNTDGGSIENVGRKIPSGSSVIYRFDLNDEITEAEVKVYGRFFDDHVCGLALSYSLDNEQFTPLEKVAGDAWKMGGLIYPLKADEALAGEDKVFYLKLDSQSNELALINLFIGEDQAQDETIVLNAGTESHIRHFENAVLENTYVFEGAFRYMILNGGSVTWSFDLPDDWENVEISYRKIQSEAVLRYADQNGSIVLNEGETLEKYFVQNPEKKFTLTVEAPGPDNLIFGDLTLNRSAGTVEEPLPSEDEKEITFTTLSEEETAYMVEGSDTVAGTIVAQLGNFENTGRQIPSGKAVTYRFNLADDMNSANLRLYGKLAADSSIRIKVEYALSGSEEFTELPVAAGSIYNTGTYSFALSEKDALADAGRTFLIRITSLDDSVCLSHLYLGTDTSIPGDQLSVAPMTAEHLKYFENAALEYVLNNNGTPALFVLAGGFLTYHFTIPEDWENVSLAYSGDHDGLQMSCTNGTDTLTVSGRAGTLELESLLTAENREIHVTLAQPDAPAGNAVVTAFSLAKAAASTGKGPNLNQSVPADQSEIYFAVGTESENLFKFSSERVSFDQTHEGMATDDANGGWQAGTLNARRMLTGQYLVYEFDLQDTAEQAVLKMYGSAGLTVQYSLDEGGTWADLKAAFLPYQLGYQRYDLTAEDALKNDDASFRIKITGPGYLDEVYLSCADQKLSDSLYLSVHTEDMIRYLWAGANNYTYVSYNKTPMMFLVGKDEQMVFRFPLAEGVQVRSLLSTLVSNGDNTVSLEVSADGEQYIRIMTSIDGGGTPSTQQTGLPEEMQQAVAESGVLFVRLYSNHGQSFVRDLGIVISEESNSGKFTVFEAEEAAFAEDLNKTLWQFTGDEDVPLRTITSQDAAVYRFDLPDGTDRMAVELFIKGEYRIMASADGVNFEEVHTAYSAVGLNEMQTVYLYDVFENNDSGIVYLSVSALYDGSPAMLRSLSFYTENIPDPEDPEEEGQGGSFDYEGLPDHIDPPEEDSEPGKSCTSGQSAASVGILLLTAAAAIIIKRRG